MFRDTFRMSISKVTGKIAGALKWVFTEMEKFILKKILGTSQLSFSLVTKQT